MTLRILATSLHRIDLRTRMPFKYGIATMTETPHVFVGVRALIDGRESSGLAADHLPPKWFTKDPAKAIDVEIAEMVRVIEHAQGIAKEIAAASVFDAWQQLYRLQDEWGKQENLPPLLVHFGTSLVERALIEAFCRAAGRPFARLLRENAFGIRLSEIHPSLAGKQPADLLPARPLDRIIARHTVGMADPLTDAEIPPAERLDDGLPQSLEACIRAYGLRHIKIKLSGDVDRDRERLGRIAGVMGGREFAFSVDGNEHFRSAADFRRFWEALTALAELRDLILRLLYVEQPLHRDVALDPAAGSMQDWRDRPMLIIDESDGDLTCLPRALDLGYTGTSHKNCKGVFKGIANACLLEHRRRQGRPAILSGEDLANIGPVALLQDLAVCASLGIESVERNGHHYFAGLSMFPPDLWRQMLESHGDLYHRSRDGWPTLTIRDGYIQTRSVVEAPFGVGPVIDVAKV